MDELPGAETGELAVSRGARDLLSRSRSVPAAVLDALDLPSGTARRLLERQGADIDAVREDLRRLVDDAAAAGRGEDDSTVEVDELPDIGLLDGEVATARRRSATFPAAPELVWDLVSTAEGNRRWLQSTDDLQVSAPDQIRGAVPGWRGQRDPGKIRGSFFRRLLVARSPGESSPGHALWQEHITGRTILRRVRSGPGQWFHITVTPVALGTRVDLVQGTIIHGRSWRLFVPLVRALMSMPTRISLHRLGLVLEEEASDPDPH